MYTFSFLLLLGSLLISQTLGAITSQVSRLPLSSISKHLISRADNDTSWLLPIPSQDPWFVPADGWESKSPGDVLKVRSSAYNQCRIGNCLDTFQVQYRTEDSNNNASWATTTVYMPLSHYNCSTTHQELCSHGVVTYAVPYDSADPDATPSYLLQYGEPYGEIYDLLNRGWFVNSPDYEGPNSSYCAGVQAGHATLDSMRAVLKVAGQFGFRTSDNKSAIWGYSGGAMATGFASELAAKYAPDLKIDAIVHGGLIPNVTQGGENLDGKSTSGLEIAGIVGITSQHADARAYVNSRLKQEGPFNASRFYSVAKYSGSDVLYAYINESAADYFIGGAEDLVNPIMQKMYNDDAVLGYHGIPNMPVFLYKAIQDEMSSALYTDELVDFWCKNGANILYHRNRVGGHNQELWQGRHRALDFLSAAIDGTNATLIPPTGCRTENVTVAVNVTLVNTTALWGKVGYVPYQAITVEQVDVTLFDNGTMLLPLGNGTSILTVPVINKRFEGYNALGLTKRWASSLSNSFRRTKRSRARVLI